MGPREPSGSVLSHTPRAALAECCPDECHRPPRIHGRSRSAGVVVARQCVGPRSRHVPAIAGQMRLPAIWGVTDRRIRRCDIGAPWPALCDHPRSCVSGFDSERVGAAEPPNGSGGRRNSRRSWASRTTGPARTRYAHSYRSEDGDCTKHASDILFPPMASLA
jgi:hypothetical protein